MEREEQFENQNMICRRRELPGCPVEIVVKEKTMEYQGREIPMVVRECLGETIQP